MHAGCVCQVPKYRCQIVKLSASYLPQPIFIVTFTLFGYYYAMQRLYIRFMKIQLLGFAFQHRYIL